MEKVYIKDKQGAKVLPITHVSAVLDDNGNDVEALMGRFEDDVRNMVRTPHENYVTVATITELNNIPTSGRSEDTIYRVSSYDGSVPEVNVTKYSQYSWDGSQYVFLCVKSQIDEVFDITVYNSNTTYTDLADALGSGGANIPETLRRGGMSVKFVQTSDNKYVQFRLMSDSFNTTVANWQGVDDEPTIASKNLVLSGGILKRNNVIHYTSPTSSAAWGSEINISNIPDGTKIFFTIKHKYPKATSTNFGLYNSTPTRIANLIQGEISEIEKAEGVDIIYPYLAETTQAGDVSLFMGTDKELLIQQTVDIYNLQKNYEEINNLVLNGIFSTNKIVNQLFKELYVIKTPYEDNSILYVRMIVTGADNLWRISFNRVGYTTSSTVFDFNAEENGLVHLKNEYFEAYAVLNWKGLDSNKTYVFTDQESPLKNYTNIAFSPTIFSNQDCGELKEEIQRFGYNVFNDSVDGYIGDTGHLSVNSDFRTSDYLSVNEGDNIYFTGAYTISQVFSAVWGYADKNEGNPVALLAWSKATYDNQKITIPSGVKYVRAWVKKSDCPNPSLSFVSTSKDNSNTIIVKKDGTGDYTSVVAAVNAVSDTSVPNNILIYPGTYDIISEYFGENDYTDSDAVGLVLPQNVNLIGCGKRGEIILDATFPSTIKYNTSNHFSPINLRGRDNKLQNLTIQCFNCRYPVHDQAAGIDNAQYTHEYIDVTLIHNGYDSGATGTSDEVSVSNNDTQHRWNSCCALGQGTVKVANIICKHVEFNCAAQEGSTIITHDAKEELTQGVSIIFDCCKFVNASSGYLIFISSLGRGYENSLEIKNCIFKGSNKKIYGRISPSGYNSDFIYNIYGNKTNSVAVELPNGYSDNDWTV